MKTKIVEYSNISQVDDYIKLIDIKYHEYEGFNYFIHDLKAALNYTIKNKSQKGYFIKVYNNADLIAHVGLILDERFKNGEAIFGFFECVNDKSVFDNLWQTLTKLEKEKNINCIKGPINATTWHQYRITVPSQSNYPLFTSEPLNENYYYEFLKDKAPSECIFYYSGLRKKFDAILQATKPDFLKTTKEGLKIKINNAIRIDDLGEILALSNNIFKNNWGFVSFNEEEFIDLYSESKLDKFIQSVYLAYFNSELIGFCSLIKKEQTLIIKTIGIVPEFQSKGIGNAIIHKVHRDAINSGIDNIIYALIYNENKVKHFPKEDTFKIREYICLSFNI